MRKNGLDIELRKSIELKSTAKCSFSLHSIKIRKLEMLGT